MNTINNTSFFWLLILYAFFWVPSHAAAEANIFYSDSSSRDATVWWIGGDPHVGWGIDPDHYSYGRTGHGAPEQYPGQHLRKSVADVNRLGIADYAVMLGDLVADDVKYADIFVREMDKLETPYGWTYVLGNHDFHGPDGRAMGDPVLPVRYKARTIMGIRFIFLSTDRNGNLVGDEQKEWFWKEMEAHRGKATPIFLFTHHQHWNIGNLWSDLEEVIEDYNIAAWFSAHSHNWNILDDSGHGFVQINIHSIGGTREDYLSSFLSLEQTEKAVEATVTFRNHQSRKWIDVDGAYQLHFTVEIP